MVVTQNQTHLPVTFAFAQKRIHLLLAYVLRTFEENATPLQCIVMTVGIVVYLLPRAIVWLLGNMNTSADVPTRRAIGGHDTVRFPKTLSANWGMHADRLNS